MFNEYNKLELPGLGASSMLDDSEIEGIVQKAFPGGTVFNGNKEQKECVGRLIRMARV